MIGILLALLAIAAIYYFVNMNSDFFEQRGIKYSRGIPGFGMMLDPFLQKKHWVINFRDIYNKFPDRKFFGVYEFTKPLIVLRDIELIKQVTVKDFDHFLNHRTTIDENIDRLFGRSLFLMTDQKWRDMRSTLSPAFTGSKMRQMFKLIMEVADENMKYLKSQLKNSVLEVELYDLLSRYANDVIAKCAYGVTVNSFKDRENEFYKMGSKFLKFDKKVELKFFLFSAFPNLMKFLKLTFFDNKCGEFFKRILFSCMDFREKNNIVIPDMVNLLMQVRKEGVIKKDDDETFKDSGFATVQESDAITNSASKTKFDDDDLIGQAMVFFLGGFDTVAISMCFTAHLLAINPDCQEKLVSEIDDLLQNLDGKLPTYEDIQGMEYLDMVVSETLRMYTPGFFLDRKCNQRTVIRDSDDNPVVLNPGDAVIIPADAIHMDEKYFPNPTKFDPERFSKDNRHKIQPFTYNPFGIGPRNCIGSRFALMECKAVIFSLLSVFKIEKYYKTSDPIELVPNKLNLRIKGDFYVRLRLRN